MDSSHALQIWPKIVDFHVRGPPPSPTRCCRCTADGGGVAGARSLRVLQEAGDGKADAHSGVEANVQALISTYSRALQPGVLGQVQEVCVCGGVSIV